MDYRKTLSDTNVQKLLKHYRRYQLARWLLLNPIFRVAFFIVGGLLLIIIWPFALLYLAYRTIRFLAKRPQPPRRFTKDKDIIDL